MGGEDSSYNNHSKKKKGMCRKARKGSHGFDGDGHNKNQRGGAANVKAKSRKMSTQQSESEPQKPFVRKQIDPETSKYFSEIANLFESNEVDLEERSVICGNALEETRGKEYEISTDYIVSHVLQTLLEGCELDHLCSFLRNSAKVFPGIAMDRSGSHVAESALKSLASHLKNPDAYSVIEETLNEICKVIVDNPIDMMFNCYGSHVLRRLFCLFRGVSLDSSELHGAKSSKVLAERLNLRTSQPDGNNLEIHYPGFPDVFKSLLSGILRCSREDMKYLQVDQYGSLVFQTALKLIAGDNDELLEIIPLILGCSNEKIEDGNRVETNVAGDILESLKENSFSHLMEVILEVAPVSLYNEIFDKIFKNSLLELSLDRCGNFVIQALVSHARDTGQMSLIWDELGAHFRDLLEQGRSGVVASLIAASQRLQSHEHKCCEALAAAVCSENGSRSCIVPRLLFLDNYFGSQNKSEWEWATGSKIHVMGSLILQEIFKFSSDLIQPYIASMTSIKDEQTIEAAKDGSGARVIEAFLGSNAAVKQKRRLVMKLRGHFGELALHSSGSFTVEKCFNASNLTLKEAIATELVDVATNLSKTKQGPYLLRKLDIDGYAARPDQWRSRQESKQSAYKEFCSVFGSSKSNSSKNTFLSDASKDASQADGLKDMRDEIGHRLGFGSSKRYREEHRGTEYEPRKKTLKTKNTMGEVSSEKAVTNKRPFLSGETTGKTGTKRQTKKLRF
ncbi:PREDICTED: pumilio homolog 23 isoform X2 [Tarenaya hassleriana]|nr:PREDICTED: pumilio homolog 23 isoform X2 [Tarenaya hassleriana]XP_010540107.1 PREDICTED: pumilio homolog 23 isoform X2 [Tarenaya hassleriana]